MIDLSKQREWSTDNPFVRAFPERIETMKTTDNSSLTTEDMRRIAEELHRRSGRPDVKR